MEGFVQAKPFRKMGIHSSRTGELFFNNVRLGATGCWARPRQLLRRRPRPARGPTSRLPNGSAWSRWRFGAIEECLRLCVDYAKTRTFVGQGDRQFQLIQLKLANMEVARMNVPQHAVPGDRVRADRHPDLVAEASAMKYYCSQAATDVAMDAVQLFGGNGYMTEYRVEQLARDAKSLMIYAGSNEVQITHVAKGLLSG